MPMLTRGQELQTVSFVDIGQYTGKWYEIASFPQRFQKGCNCTTAEYSFQKNGTIAVKNRCIKNGKEKIAKAVARVKDKKTNAKLSVRFFWPFTGKYWIIDLDDHYTFAVVGHPNRKYLWILSRTPHMEEATYQQILNRVKAKGFDISRLRKTDQSCND